MNLTDDAKIHLRLQCLEIASRSGLIGEQLIAAATALYNFTVAEPAPEKAE